MEAEDLRQKFSTLDARLLEHDKAIKELNSRMGVLENASKDSFVRIGKTEQQLSELTAKVDRLSGNVDKMSRRIQANGRRDQRTQYIVAACLGLTVALFVYVVLADKASAREILKTAADVSAIAGHLL